MLKTEIYNIFHFKYIKITLSMTRGLCYKNVTRASFYNII